MNVLQPLLVTLVAGLFAVLFATPLSAAAQQKNGFNLDNALVPADEVLQGGPPRDGIPSIDQPVFVPPAKATLWRQDDLMLTFDGTSGSYAYPVGILNWHEIVNHDPDGKPLLITFCPLCGTGIAFDPVVDGKRLSFGVSGLLYNSDLLMYDRQTESLWSQIEGRAIAGPLAGKRLEPVAIRHERLGQWRERVGSNGWVLSTDTGHKRDYRQSPYGEYDHSERLYFPVTHTSRKYHPKTWVLGWTHNGESKVWPFPELAERDAPLEDRIGGKKVQVHYDPTVPSAELRDESGKLLPATRAFWFAWYTFHPETLIFEAD
ncbi:DUF3179 domain-containing protein [Marinobacter sp. CHS3-4]|uniref:DUF3179 domain-containing protein n=1 Tax=Marinobacter sp. CHS3-4 TaxID=3045174 RepID=UPI0024B4BA1D|nr:DUF3179 domain-containing protein [Marinobacter sp. CHS3-4]MDI9243680.1 DUF3179 domain-containing protein [Marinobacter sp. CHS3-4]